MFRCGQVVLLHQGNCLQSVASGMLSGTYTTDTRFDEKKCSKKYCSSHLHVPKLILPLLFSSIIEIIHHGLANCTEKVIA